MTEKAEDQAPKTGGAYAHYVLAVLVIVYFFNFVDRNLYVVDVAGEPEFSVSAPRVVIRLNDGVDSDFDISPDGQRFLLVDSAVAARDGDRNTGRVNVVLNWFEDVKARAPLER